MAVLQEKQLFITIVICGLTNNKQYKSKLRTKLTQTLIFFQVLICNKCYVATWLYEEEIS